MLEHPLVVNFMVQVSADYRVSGVTAATDCHAAAIVSTAVPVRLLWLSTRAC